MEKNWGTENYVAGHVLRAECTLVLKRTGWRSTLFKVYIMSMSVDVALTDARSSLGELAARVEYGGETVYLTLHGRRAAAVVSAPTAELIERVEDLLDVEAALEVLARLEAGTEGRRRVVSAPPASS